MSSIEARNDLHKLLDRIERQTESERSRPITGKLRLGGLNGPYEEYRAVLENASKIGAVSLEKGKGEISHLFARVQLINSASLYRFLDRTPAWEEANNTYTLLCGRVSTQKYIVDILPNFKTAWLTNQSYLGVSRHHLETAVNFLTALNAVLESNYNSLDMRTISRRRTGNSKLIEQHMKRISRWYKSENLAEQEQNEREVFASIGLEKYPQDVKISGPLIVDGIDISRFTYLGVPTDSIDNISSAPGPIITIENLASFNRYVREARQKNETVIFTGGFPSQAVVQLLKTISNKCSPIWHWGDIDPTGIKIAMDLQKHLIAEIKPLLMSPQIANTYGSISTEPIKPLRMEYAQAIPTPWQEIATYLCNDKNKTLEQEELDPISPYKS